MAAKVTNNAYGTLSAGITNTATTLTLNSGEGARFPALGSGDYFYATLVDTSNNLEIIKVTARSIDSMTIVRGQDGTTARAYALNDRLELRPVAALFNEKADTSYVDTGLAGKLDYVAPGSSGNVLTSNGSGWTSQALSIQGRLIGYQVFTATGTYSKGTNNPSFIVVEVIGGGGSGSSQNGSTVNSGGGAGAYARKKLLASALAASETVTVGAGGAAVVNGGNRGGNAGGTSSFGSHISCTGGSAGSATVNNAAGGTTSGNDVNINGQQGTTAQGGTSFMGMGSSRNIPANTNVSAAFGYGSGSGASTTGNTSNYTVGAGGPGLVIVWEYA